MLKQVQYQNIKGGLAKIRSFMFTYSMFQFFYGFTDVSSTQPDQEDVQLITLLTDWLYISNRHSSHITNFHFQEELREFGQLDVKLFCFFPSEHSHYGSNGLLGFTHIYT